jgi:DNA-binding MarR family transcriptional regulator
VAGKLQAEIKQSRDFKSLAEEANLNIIRTAEWIGAVIAETLKPHGLTRTQYNALRILRGAGKDGLQCGEIGERMITKESDITRLLDRLEARELISRERQADNRRVVITKITSDGRRLVDSLDADITAANQTIASDLNKTEITALIRTLEKIRRT